MKRIFRINPSSHQFFIPLHSNLKYTPTAFYTLGEQGKRSPPIAAGGAIVVNTNLPNTKFTLSASAGKRAVIQGNTANTSRRNDGTGSLSGDFSQRAGTASVAASYAVRFGRAVLTPMASFRWVGLEQNRLRERGGLTAARVGKAGGDSFASDLGLRFSGDIATGCGVVSPYAHAGWRHEFGDRDIASKASYSVLPGMSYRLSSAARDKDAAILGAGLTARRELASGHLLGANLGYAATLGSHTVEHTLSAMLELGF